MSYIMSQIRCDHCKLEMNVAFGIVGHSIIAEWPKKCPKKCPKCAGDQFTKIADGWTFEPVASPSPGAEPTT